MSIAQYQGSIALRNRRRRKGSGFIGRFAVAAAMLTLAGACQAPPPATPKPGTLLTHQQASNMPLEKDIGGVAAFYDPYTPWIWNDDRSKIRGIVVNALYLIGPNSLGAFADGVIRPRLYLLEGPTGREQPQLLKEWSFDPDAMLDWRSRKRTAMGWGYKLPLVWGDDIDLRGKSIRVTISFERVDGRIIHSSKKDFRLPA